MCPLSVVVRRAPLSGRLLRVAGSGTDFIAVPYHCVHENCQRGPRDFERLHRSAPRALDRAAPAPPRAPRRRPSRGSTHGDLKKGTGIKQSRCYVIRAREGSGFIATTTRSTMPHRQGRLASWDGCARDETRKALQPRPQRPPHHPLVRPEDTLAQRLQERPARPLGRSRPFAALRRLATGQAWRRTTRETWRL